MFEKQEQAQRINVREMARELTAEEMEIATGGTTSCSGCRADDCDQSQQRTL